VFTWEKRIPTNQKLFQIILAVAAAAALVSADEKKTDSKAKRGLLGLGIGGDSLGGDLGGHELSIGLSDGHGLDSRGLEGLSLSSGIELSSHGLNEVSLGGQGLGDGAIISSQDHHVPTNVITKTVPYSIPQPVPVTIHKAAPYAVQVPVPVPVDRPVPVIIRKPYHVTIDRPVPVTVEKPVPYPVKVPVKVAVPHPVPVEVPKPYPVHVSVPRPYKVPVPVLIKSHDTGRGLESYGLESSLGSSISLGHGSIGLGGSYGQSW